MKELGKWQLISLASRGVAMFFGLIQSFFIVRLLTVGEWGLVQIAASIGGAFGIYQHLGLASGSTREISAAKSDDEVFRIFLTSVFIRYLVTIPIAIFLFVGASNIANIQYHQPELELPIKIYALVLLFQGIQSILNSVISGTQRFKRLFLYQVGIAAISVAVYLPFVFAYKINGYFYALAVFNLISSLILSYLAFKPLNFKLVLPTRHEFRSLFKDLLSISLAIYIVKVIYTMWEKSGPILLGVQVTPETVGIFAFALLYAKKLVAVSDAVTDVNLPVFSEKYVKNFEDFKTLFTRNFEKVFVFILFSAFSAIYWAPQFVRLALGDERYQMSYGLIGPMVFAFIFYSIVNILKSSVFIPAKMTKEMVIAFGLMLLATGISFFVLSQHIGYLYAMTWGMLIGSLFAAVCMAIFARLKLKFGILGIGHVLLVIQSVFISYTYSVDNSLVKAAFYPVFVALFMWAAYASKFITIQDIERVFAVVKQSLRPGDLKSLPSKGPQKAPKK